MFQLGRFYYQVPVTTLSLQPLNLWRFYNDRGRVSLVIRRLKDDYLHRPKPGHHFLARDVYCYPLLLAYNLVIWFKRLCLPLEAHNAALQTLRKQSPSMPAQLVEV